MRTWPQIIQFFVSADPGGGGGEQYQMYEEKK